MEAAAKRLGADELRPSWRKNKKMAVLYRGRWMHFGAKGYEDYTTHGDEKRRQAYRKRAAGILTADGKRAYLDKTRPAFWAYYLLW